METNTQNIDSVIKESLNKSISYQAYRNLISKLVEEKSTTGLEKTDALANYTMLNNKRMKRWDKTVKLSETLQNKIKNYDKEITLLVLTESWCGDAAHIIPVINKVAELNPNIKLELVFRDENETLMNKFLTNGAKSIPKVIAFNKENVINFTYGPRPTAATQMVNAYKSEHGKLTPEFKEDLQHWYNRDKGQAILNDLEQLLNL